MNTWKLPNYLITEICAGYFNYVYISLDDTRGHSCLVTLTPNQTANIPDSPEEQLSQNSFEQG